jgi:aspartate/methionine/tyrosine aminotransferase
MVWCSSATRCTASSSTTLTGRLHAACDLYERAVSLGSISKTYGLPGLRLGWLATHDAALRDALLQLKDCARQQARSASRAFTA